MTGVVNLYKPKGITSSQAVVKAKKILGTKAVGHMGTLDPQGEGVLILGVGKATRLFDYYLGKDKEYEAEFTFGEERDTLDGEGVITQSGGKIPDIEEIRGVLPFFTGRQLQTPPAYSAKKIEGRKAYDLARSGVSVELKPCEIEIYSLDLLSAHENRITVKVHCSSGTYIRSLCRDIAYKLGTYAIMTAIKRTRCGSFTAEKATRFEDLSVDSVMTVEQAMPEIERLDLSDEYYKRLKNGLAVETQRKGRFLVFCKGELFGIGEAKDDLLRIKIYLREE